MYHHLMCYLESSGIIGPVVVENVELGRLRLNTDVTFLGLLRETLGQTMYHLICYQETLQIVGPSSVENEELLSSNLNTDVISLGLPQETLEIMMGH